MLLVLLATNGKKKRQCQACMSDVAGISKILTARSTDNRKERLV